MRNGRQADIIFNPTFIPCFSGFMFSGSWIFWVHVFQGPGRGFRSSPKVDRRFSLLRHNIYDYNFSFSLSINVRKYKHQTWLIKVFIYIMIFVFRNVFLFGHTKDFVLQNNLSVTQTMLIFLYAKDNVWKYKHQQIFNQFF